MLAEDATIDIADFERVDMRVGRVLMAEPFPEARKPAYKLRIDFGPLGIRRASAQLTVHYQPDELRAMFGRFGTTSVRAIATVYDRKWLGPLGRFVPDFLGWNLAVEAVK